MRKLFIRREKSFVGCLGKYKVYLQDENSNDLKIKKEKYRKLGVLKNGKDACFEIPNEEAKLYVIAGKTSKGFCNDMIKLPSGEADIYLVGKSSYNPFKGNPFRFSNPITEEMLQNRKSTNKVIAFWVAFYIVCIVAGFIVGFTSAMADLEPEVFNADEMSITLTGEFEDLTTEEDEFVFAGDDTSVVISKTDFNYFEQPLTLEEYSEAVLLSLDDTIPGISKTAVLEKVGDAYTFESLNYEGFSEVIYLYESEDAFWMVVFTCYEEDYAYYETYFDEWAASVNFE